MMHQCGALQLETWQPELLQDVLLRQVGDMVLVDIHR